VGSRASQISYELVNSPLRVSASLCGTTGNFKLKEVDYVMPSGRIGLIRSSHFVEPVHLDRLHYTHLFICIAFLFWISF